MHMVSVTIALIMESEQPVFFFSEYMRNTQMHVCVRALSVVDVKDKTVARCIKASNS